MERGNPWHIPAQFHEDNSQPWSTVADTKATQIELTGSNSSLRGEISKDEDRRTTLEDKHSLPIVTGPNHGHEGVSDTVVSQVPVLAAPEPLEDEEGNDSGYDEPDARRDSQVSVSPSVRDGIEQYGRLYQNDNYILPRDEREQERLDIAHNVSRNYIMNGKLYHAPLGQIHNALDVGTGTGIWAMEFADEKKEAVVLGIDISPIQPSEVPTNLFFQILDAELPWDFKIKFDYIHIGNTIFECLENVFRSAYQYLQPDGYLEIQDIPLKIYNEGDQAPIHLREWEEYVFSGAPYLRHDFLSKYEVLMRKHGFKKIKSVVKKCPIGWHPSEEIIGACFLELALSRLEPYSLVPLRTGLTNRRWEDVQVLNALARKDIKNRKYHLSLNSIVIYGQK